MVEIPNFFNLEAVSEFATSQGFAYWIVLGINIILSTIIGGIILVIILSIFSKKFGEAIKLGNAFILVLLVNVINFFGVIGLVLLFLPSISIVALILPVLIWIVLTKLFFSGLKLLHAVIIGVVFYLITMFLIPVLVGMVWNYIPFIPTIT